MAHNELAEAQTLLVKLCSNTSSGKDAEGLLECLHRAANVCTTANVQRCTARIIATIFGNSIRATALCRFLVALSKTFAPVRPLKRATTTPDDERLLGLPSFINGKAPQLPQPHFKRLHVLYVLSDVLLYMRRHAQTFYEQANADSHAVLKRHLPYLAALAAFTGNARYAKTSPHVLALLKNWSDAKVLSEAQAAKIYAQVSQADAGGVTWEVFRDRIGAEEAGAAAVVAEEAKRSTFALPRHHGVPNDPTAPWHHLPAANGLYMKRTKGYPLRASALPVGGYELVPPKKEPIPAPALVRDVRWLHQEMLHAFEKPTKAENVKDVDAMGNIIYKSRARPTRNYYGWTLKGVKKIKAISMLDRDKATGYGEELTARRSDPMEGVNAAVERARSLAADRAGGGRGRGTGPGGPRGGRGWRGGRRR
ncbi:hypothetical protein LTR53_002411 [Teratosphaeriaceae sp. CCFEE 6253]|nr:hypothetical protein LTR53_002411 [Teratosphaeriaceae sp. CCFEE 6253]